MIINIFGIFYCWSIDIFLISIQNTKPETRLGAILQFFTRSLHIYQHAGKYYYAVITCQTCCYLASFKSLDCIEFSPTFQFRFNVLVLAKFWIRLRHEQSVPIKINRGAISWSRGTYVSAGLFHTYSKALERCLLLQ